MKFRRQIFRTGIAVIIFMAMSVVLSMSVEARPSDGMPDGMSGCYKPDTVSRTDSDSAFTRMPWWKQVVASGFHINDPRIDYPRFPRFILDIYNWGDRTFNSYDSTYVVGTGKNWKVMAKNYNWFESYMLMYGFDDRLNIRSEFYNDVGAYLCFMAVSLGYTAKIGNFLGNGRLPRTNFNVSFTCSRFEGMFETTSTSGNTYITRLGEYNHGKGMDYPFNDIHHESMRGRLLYFFNNRRYSHAAAYCYSKYQIKSAGTWIAGGGFNYQDIAMDFSSLPSDMQDALPGGRRDYVFRYCDYLAYGGYARNFVLKPRRWLINLMGVQSLGYRHSYSQPGVRGEVCSR